MKMVKNLKLNTFPRGLHLAEAGKTDNTRNLLENDVVIFQVVSALEPAKLKVYIVRANSVASKDGALGCVNLDANKLDDAVMDSVNEKSLAQCATKRKCLKTLERAAAHQKTETGLEKFVSKTMLLPSNSKNGQEEYDVEIISSPCYSPSPLQFKDVKSFEDFSIMVGDLCIDSELPDHIRHTYYDICSIKRIFLHTHLMQGLNSKLAAGIICQTVNITDSIETCSLTTSRSEFANLETTLKSLHFMGMRVGFISSRVRKLVEIAFEVEDVLESSDVKVLKSKKNVFEQKFQKEVDAIW